LFNIKPPNWRHCVDGPPNLAAHNDHVGHPWQGLNERIAWGAEEMEEGHTAIVRQSEHGVMGIWEIKSTRPIVSQDNHEWPEEYEQFVYCRGLERELDPPVDDTDFLHRQEYVRFNKGANRLSEEYTEKFLKNVLERPDLSQAAATRLRTILRQLDSSELPERRQVEVDIDTTERPSDISSPKRTETTVSRIVRNTQLVKELKERYDYQCQVCGERRHRGQTDAYAEGHHLHPLGDDPPGLDQEDNIIVLCPNHHADFDYGVIEVDPDTLEIAHAHESQLNGRRLLVEDGHDLGTAYLRYHLKEKSVL
jgi:5-methylcytosine-specific restriction endonuclease McrA